MKMKKLSGRLFCRMRRFCPVSPDAAAAEPAEGREAPQEVEEAASQKPKRPEEEAESRRQLTASTSASLPNRLPSIRRSEQRG